MTAQLDLENLDLTGDPETQNEVFLAAFNSGRGEIFDKLYRKDAISNLSGKPLTGAARTQAVTDLLAGKPKLNSKVRHSYIAGDTSLIIVDFELEVSDEAGRPRKITGVCTDVLVREPNGKWVMAIDRPIPVGS